MARPHHLILAIASLLLATSTASAQGGSPDIRNIRPIVMLMVDTSGSMEKALDCECTTAACTECYPVCDSGVGTDQRNRWATVLEALTGTFSDFECNTEIRTGGVYAGQYDDGYFLPHFRPLYSGQNPDGILDAYAERIRFGLMTFDTISTFTDAGTLVDVPTFLARLPDNISDKGMFSYGEPHELLFPGCLTRYMVDNGARNADLTNGGTLVSVGSEAVVDDLVNNGLIQTTLLDVRPHGATPIAGMLDDFRYYINNNPDIARRTVPDGPGDPYYACRPRFGVLLTDGAPNADFRGPPYFCDAGGGAYSCPYDLPADVAQDMCRYDSVASECDGIIDGLYVVGYGVAAVDVPSLDDIARMGGTDSALVASTYSDLVDRLGEVLDSVNSGSTTRSVPAFANNAGSGSNLEQRQLESGFKVGDFDAPWSGVLTQTRYECNAFLDPEAQPVEDSDRYHLKLNAQGPRNLLTVVPTDIRDLDKHLIGEDTGIPTITGGGGAPGGSHGRGPGGLPPACFRDPGGGGGGGPGGGGPGSYVYTGPAETGLTLQSFDTGNPAVSKQVLGVPTDTDRVDLINLVEGNPGTARENARLGDIYHSSPVVVGPISLDLPDESYNRFRQRTLDNTRHSGDPVPATLESRPRVTYVGSNDGILHAFAVDGIDCTGGRFAGQSFETGEEVWGFIPPMLLPRLEGAMTSHQYMLDGTPVVKDVFYRRLPGEDASGDIWHTILIVPFGRGGPGYLAMDVTDPCDPKFLWQFTHPDMGLTLGTPGLAQVLIRAGGVLQERVIGFLPAGSGLDLMSTDTTGRCGRDPTGPIGCPSMGKGTPPVTDGTIHARDRQRCWDTTGRGMYFIDPATGEVAAALDDTVFNAPVTGGVAFFTGDVSTIASRAYFADHDGVLWRLDVSSTNMADWDADPFFDMFHDTSGSDVIDGQPAYFPPVLSTDDQGQVVVVQATGDQSRFDAPYSNRVVSLTEVIDSDPLDGSVRGVTATRNWEIDLEDGRQVTGPLELFDKNIYFATFWSRVDTVDACQYGESHLWGVNYRLDDGSDYPLPGLRSTPTTDPPDLHYLPPFENQIVQGVSVTQRPNCLLGVDETDTYIGRRFRVTDQGGGQFQLVANVSGTTVAAGEGDIAQITIDLPPPASITQSLAFNPVAD